MKYKVPQFIEVEDKIFGPLTAKQFVYLAGGVGVLVLLYSVLPALVAIILGAPIVALGAMMAFYKKNNIPFTKLLEYAFYYYYRNKLYIWQHRNKTSTGAKKAAAAGAEMFVPKLTESKLKDLAWSLDIKEHSFSPPRGE